ncbi:hypothetical protein THAOC_12023, partial [Thalassiosira oceanica]
MLSSSWFHGDLYGNDIRSTLKIWAGRKCKSPITRILRSVGNLKFATERDAQRGAQEGKGSGGRQVRFRADSPDPTAPSSRQSRPSLVAYCRRPE